MHHKDYEEIQDNFMVNRLIILSYVFLVTLVCYWSRNFWSLISIWLLFAAMLTYMCYPRFCFMCRTRMKRTGNGGLFPEVYFCDKCKTKITLKIQNGNWAS